MLRIFNPKTAMAVCALLMAVYFVWPIPAHADTPTFDVRKKFGTGSDQTISVAVGDVDGDGDLDLITGNFDQNVVYLNDGTGNFPTGRNFGTGNDHTSSIAVGDVDGDGDLDLITRTHWQNVVYLNDGAGNFSAGQNLWTGSGVIVAVGDVDGDGNLDLITGNNGGQNVIYLNDGTGNFPPAGRNFGTGSDRTGILDTGDVDGDGDLDLITGNYGEQNVIYLNDGTGNFPPAGRNFGTSSDRTSILATGDVDGDGDLDLITSNDPRWNGSQLVDGQNVVYLNDGAGNFPTGRNFGSDSDNTNSFTVGDVDGDGHLDLIASNSGQNVLYMNHRDGNFSTGLNLGTSSSVIIAGDVDGDSDLDLITGNRASDYGVQNVIYLNDGVGNFPVGQNFSTDSNQTSAVAIGDVDGDGDLDLIIGNHSEQNIVYLNDGTGNFPVGRNFGTGSDRTSSIAVGDVDGDGHLDLITGNHSEQNIVYLNDGTGNFPVGRNFGTGSDRTSGIAVGDVDGDGHLDLITGNSGEQNVIYLNDGMGNFLIGRNFGASWGYTESIAVGDVNGDNNLDIIAGNGQGEQNVVYLNDGGGNFPPIGRTFGIVNHEDTTASIAVGDVDSDGDLDLITGNNSGLQGGQNVVYLNDGTGNFQVGRDFGTGSDWTYSVAVGDLDGDSDFDLITGNAGDQNMVYLNDGVGNFLIGRKFGTGIDLTHDVAVGDIDDDGNLDIITGNFGEQNVGYLNRLQRAKGLPNNAPLISVTRPIATGNANFYSTPLLVDNNIIPLTYTLFDPEGDKIGRVEAFYSLNGGGQWFSAVAATGTVTSNLSTGYAVRAARHYSPSQTISDVAPTVFPLIITDTSPVADIEVTLSLSHTRNSDLQAALISPAGSRVTLFNGLSGQGLRNTRFDDQAATSIISGTAPFTLTYRPQETLAQFHGQPMNGTWQLIITDTTAGESGSLSSWGMQLKTPPATHVYTWDTFRSGFFGQSDNVVIRMVAYPQPATPAAPGTYKYPNTVPGPFQRPYASATTFPFRVRGTQVQVVSATLTNTQAVSQAIVYRLPKNAPGGGLPIGTTITRPFRTNGQGYLAGRGQIGIGDQLLALAPMPLPPSYTRRYSTALRLYATNGAPTETGLDSFTVTQPGLQPLHVSANKPLLLFDLNVSLEWDASQDSIYLQQLEADLKRASDFLYDWSDGQIALGQVDVFHNAENWDYSHILVYATNRLRPFAAIGGVVLTDTVDPGNSSLSYGIGQVHMPHVWNRYGNADGNLGDDWPLILAHELGHFLLFQDDTYLGLNSGDLLIAVDTCTGSAMGDVYNSQNSEFIFEDASWDSNCAQTLAARELGRNEWQTLDLWYPWLQTPTNTISLVGPSRLPYDLTQVTIVPPLTPTSVLADPAFYLDYDGNVRSSSNARAFLQRNKIGSSSGIDAYEYVYDLGTAIGDQNRLLAKGAAPGDRLCVFDQTRGHFGCEVVSTGDERLQLKKRDNWRPLLQLSPVTSTTFNLIVSGAPTGSLSLKARLYPLYGEAFPPATLSQHGSVYSGALTLDYPSLSGWVQVYEDKAGNDRLETMTGYSIGGNPGNSRSGGGGNSRSGGGGNSRSGGGGNSRSGGGGNSRSGGGGGARPGQAPLVSPDGQMIFFAGADLTFNEGDFYTIQNMTGLPPLPPGKTVIGQGYNLVKTSSAPVLTGSISFQYRGDDVLAEGYREDQLAIHHWDGSRWQTLNSPDDARSAKFNLISAPSAGTGIYALLAGATTPQITAVIPRRLVAMTATQSITLSGGYYLNPTVIRLVGASQSYTLPVTWLATDTLRAAISPTLPVQEYQVWVENRHQPGAAGSVISPALFALFQPAPAACFYDFFESGASQWHASGEWAIGVLPDGEQAMTDSPGKPYNNAEDYGSHLLSYTTAITSEPFSLSACPNPSLTFRHDYVLAQLGGSQDLARVEISPDNGLTWHELRRYSGGSVYGLSARSSRSVALPEWTDVTWKDETIDLSAYSSATKTLRLRFSLEVDQTTADKGWLIDDLLVVSGAPGPRLTLSKTVGQPNPLPGQVISYTIQLNNSGVLTAGQLTISDTLPPGLALAGPLQVSGDASGSSVATGPADLPWLVSNLTLAPGQQVTVTLPVTVGAGPLAGAVVTNTAVVSGPSLSQPLRDRATITIANLPALAVTKQVNVAQAEVGQAIFYIYKVTNSGSVTLTNISASDDKLGPLSLNPTTLVPNQSVIDFRTYTVLDSDLPGPLTNTVVATGTAAGGGQQVSATATVSITVQPDITPPSFSQAALITPTLGIRLATPRPFFDWLVAQDAVGVISYTLVLTGQQRVEVFTATYSAFTPTLDLADGSYRWTVQAHDAAGNTSPYVSPVEQFVIAAGGDRVFLPLVVKE